VTRKLLEHYQIKKPLISYYKHNSRESGEKIVSRILNGESCALVSDAGTPAVSDPGEELVRLCISNDINIIIIPGPCAAVAALALSGLGSDRFTFEGFLSGEKKKRSRHLEELKAEKRTMIFYEAPHKLMRTLKDMYETFGDRNVSISREMTKIYEETLRMSLSEAISHFTDKAPRGEFVLVLEGCKSDPVTDNKIDDAIDAVNKMISAGISVRDAVKKAADEFDCSRNVLYKTVVSGSDDHY